MLHLFTLFFQMYVSLGVLILAFCILSINGGNSSSQTTYTNMSSSLPKAVSTVEPKVNKSKLVNNTYLQQLYAAAAGHYSDVQIFEKGFDLNETEREKFKIWPLGEIPYFIDVFSFDLEQENKIIDIFEKYSNLTGLYFFTIDEAPEEDDPIRWVLLVNRKGYSDCLHYTVENFTNVGMQRVILGWNCLRMEAGIAPLILAIAGVPSQHNSPDRDEHIKIIWDNIKPENKPLFTKLNDSDWLFHNMRYDFSSAGHLSKYVYSINGNVTYEFTNKWADQDIPYRKHLGLTNSDIKKIKMLYNYVSRIRTNPLNETRRSNNYDIDVVDDGLPRDKPRRYLGLPDPTTTTITTTTPTTTTRIPRRRRRRSRPPRIPEQIVNDMLMF